MLGPAIRPPCCQVLGSCKFQGVTNHRVFEVGSAFKSGHIQTPAGPPASTRKCLWQLQLYPNKNSVMTPRTHSRGLGCGGAKDPHLSGTHSSEVHIISKECQQPGLHGDCQFREAQPQLELYMHKEQRHTLPCGPLLYHSLLEPGLESHQNTSPSSPVL